GRRRLAFLGAPAHGRGGGAGVSPWRLTARLMRTEPRLTALNFPLWIAFHSLPLLSGLVLKAVLDAVTDRSRPGGVVVPLLAVLLGIEAVRFIEFYSAIVCWNGWMVTLGMRQRTNVMRWLLTRRDPLPASPGEAVSRLRDDVEEVLWFADTWLDFAGTLLFAGIAVGIMASINVVMTVAVALPLMLSVLVIRGLSALIKRTHARARVVRAAVTGFLGDVFAGA